MELDKKSPISRIQPDTQGVNVIYRPRSVTMHYVSSDEVRTLGSASNDFSLYLAFFGASIGIAGVCVATLTTVELKDPHTFFGYFAALMVSAPATVFFLIKAILSWRKAQQHIHMMLGEAISSEEAGRKPSPPLP